MSGVRTPRNGCAGMYTRRSQVDSTADHNIQIHEERFLQTFSERKLPCTYLSRETRTKPVFKRRKKRREKEEGKRMLCRGQTGCEFC